MQVDFIRVDVHLCATGLSPDCSFEPNRPGQPVNLSLVHGGELISPGTLGKWEMTRRPASSSNKIWESWWWVEVTCPFRSKVPRCQNVPVWPIRATADKLNGQLKDTTATCRNFLPTSPSSSLPPLYVAAASTADTSLCPQEGRPNMQSVAGPWKIWKKKVSCAQVKIFKLWPYLDLDFNTCDPWPLKPFRDILSKPYECNRSILTIFPEPLTQSGISQPVWLGLQLGDKKQNKT